MDPQLRAKQLPEDALQFKEAGLSMPLEQGERIVRDALARWHAPDRGTAEARLATLAAEFPDSARPDSYWHDAAATTFQNFFTWGHDHDFGFGAARSGAMGMRHVEITSEALSRGLLAPDLTGKNVLDIGCWSGGDLLILAGLGAHVTAIEEHPVSAASARRLCALVGCAAEIVTRSLYLDRQDWSQRFDVIYCSGVVYHVTDPVLFMRLCFAYLKPGGRLVIETKAESGSGSACGYSGTLEKGWNWFSPTRDALGRWLVDAGFDSPAIALYQRPIGRLLAGAVKTQPRRLPEPAGFSRPGSWLEQET